MEKENIFSDGYRLNAMAKKISPALNTSGALFLKNGMSANPNIKLPTPITRKGFPEVVAIV